jgi:glycosyltransferase involved in cell wall biosynthesis
MTPTVSIVLPTFNRLQYLRPAVESVFAQTFADWELIVADDGSDADTKFYLQTLLSSPRVQLLSLPHTGKPALVRNAALRKARGEYVAFLDSDDLWRPEKLRAQIESLRAHKDCRWGYTAFVYIDAAGAALHDPTLQEWYAHEGSTLEAVVDMKLMAALPSVIVERVLIVEAGLFDEEQRFYEDHDLWLRLALRGQADVVKEPLVCVRRHKVHYSGSDLVASLEGRDRYLRKMCSLVADRRLRATARRTCAVNAASLARLHASSSRRLCLRTLRDSWRYSWRYLRWWSGATAAVLRSFMPQPLIGVYRHCRNGLKRIRI